MVDTWFPFVSVATTITCKLVTPKGGVPVKRRSPGEKITQSGKGLPLAVVAEICRGVVLTLWVKVFSGRVKLKVVPGETLTTSNVLTATKLEVPWLLLPPDEVDEPTGVRLPVTAMAICEVVPDVAVVKGPAGVVESEVLTVTSGTLRVTTETVAAGMTTSC